MEWTFNYDREACLSGLKKQRLNKATGLADKNIDVDGYSI